MGRMLRASGPIGPVYPIQSLTGSAFNPALYRMEAHPKTTGYGALGGTATDGGDHRTSFLFQSTFCVMGGSSEGLGFLKNITDSQMLTLDDQVFWT